MLHVRPIGLTNGGEVERVALRNIVGFSRSEFIVGTGDGLHPGIVFPRSVLVLSDFDAVGKSNVCKAVCHNHIPEKSTAATDAAAQTAALVSHQGIAIDFAIEKVAHQISYFLTVRFQSEVPCVYQVVLEIL